MMGPVLARCWSLIGITTTWSQAAEREEGKMRKSSMMLTLVLITVAGCGILHQAAPRNSKLHGVGVEKSVFPIRAWVGMGERACTGVFVAPELFLTSGSLLSNDPDMVGKINVDDGVYTTKIDLDSERHELGNLVVFKTKTHKQPLPLRVEPLKAGQELTYVVRSFRHPKTKMRDGSRKPMWGSVAISRWKTGTAIVQEDVSGGVFVAKMPTKNMCGAVLIDEQGRIAGVVYQKEGVNGHALVASAGKIRKLLSNQKLLSEKM